MLCKFRRASLTRLAPFSLTIVLALLSGCGNNNHSVTPSPSPSPTPTPGATSTFTVTAISPASGTTGVATNAAIQITFSASANSMTVNTTSIVVRDSQSTVSGAVTYSGATNTATFTPSATLAASTTYTVKASGVTSSTGTTLTAFTSMFTTAAAPPAVTQYQDTLSPWNQGPGSGEIAMNTSGAMTVTLTGVVASTAYTLEFCPSYDIYGSFTYSCFNVGNITSDSSGNSSTTMQFPKAGNWAGEFDLNSGTKVEYQTDVIFGNTAQVYMSTLEPESTINGKGPTGTPGSPQGTLTSGTVSLSNGSLTFTLNGAMPDTAYQAQEAGVLGGSSNYELYNSSNQSSFTTNSSGDVTFTVLVTGSGGDIFQVDPANNNNLIGWIGGFSIPSQ